MSAAGLPLVELDLDGTRVEGTALTALTELRVQQRLSLPALCELTWEGLGSDALPLVQGRMGAPVRLRLGEGPVVFQGDVTACERVYEPGGTFGLRLRCYDALHRLRKRQPVRAHVAVSPGSLAREMAAEVSLRVDAADDGPVQPWLVQWRESNLELLSRLAARSGLYLAVREDALILLGLDGQGEPVQLNVSQLGACSVEVNAELACREVVALGWSTQDLEPKTASVSHARSDAAADGGAPPSVFGGLDGRTQADRLAANQAQLEAMAQGERDRRAAAEVVLRGAAPGDSRLVPGTRVRLSGVEPEPGGTFVLTSTVHLLSSEAGWTTQFETTPPPPPKEPGSIGFTLGRVSRIDPSTGRVRVVLLSFGDVESDWLNVVSPGAGMNKGMAALPDVDDRVLVLFSHEDPNDAFVAGGLYMPGALRDSGMEESGVSRYFLRTRAGQVLGFDDARSAIRLESGDGSSIEVSREFVRLHATRPLILEAPGQPITIVGKSVDFRRG